ncbi:hypothetical protein [Parasphingopyxis marina]|uniref:Uncharacterized protein n=1 Tax=Parasphingopyxis marina TaxID=2761622 RepID=A0A842HYL6_9SPHN|nr:hypothetical protein [Parasphingopyxis marina]MBC2777523.1 hypothetical protein [Parasphingopyxis marina]
MAILVPLLILLQGTTDLQAEAAAQNDALNQCIEREVRGADADLQGDALASYVTDACAEERMTLRSTAIALMTGAGRQQESAESFFDTNYARHLGELLIEIQADMEGR